MKILTHLESLKPRYSKTIDIANIHLAVIELIHTET